uniref:Uncharacterized protein n=1 Tax=Oryza meridionalis TaxID=40149 RepID=A0A0E0C8J4_9ORYZ
MTSRRDPPPFGDRGEHGRTEKVCGLELLTRLRGIPSDLVVEAAEKRLQRGRLSGPAGDLSPS